MYKELILQEKVETHRWGRFSDFAKRLFDIFVSLVALILLSPFFGLIIWAIKRNSPGPAFYHGPRVGKNGKVFQILKFRTMYETPESYAGPRVTAVDDPRITPLGHWLRNTKLNELPQFWNVLIGEMSIVGPRPEDPKLVEHWPEELRAEVLSVRPGITSPASVQYHNEETLLHSASVLQTYLHNLGPDKARLDQLYVRYRSFWLDLDTIFWTALILVPIIGRETPPEELLFVGPATRLMRRYINWFVIDLLITFTTISIIGVLWRIFTPLNAGFGTAVLVALGFSLIFSLSGVILGVNHIAWSTAPLSDSLDLLPSWALAAFIAYTANHFAQIFPEALVLLASFLTLVGFVTARFRRRLLDEILDKSVYRTRANAFQERVLVIGDGPAGQHAAWLFTHQLNAVKFKVVGFINNNLLEQGMRVYGLRVLGQYKDIPELIEKHDVGLVIFTHHILNGSEYHEVQRACSATKAKLVVIPDMLHTVNQMFSSQPFLSGTMIPQTGVDEKREQTPGCGSPGSLPEELPCHHCIFNSLKNEPK